jgi:hypothetical protein
MVVIPCAFDGNDRKDGNESDSEDGRTDFQNTEAASLPVTERQLIAHDECAEVSKSDAGLAT